MNVLAAVNPHSRPQKQPVSLLRLSQRLRRVTGPLTETEERVGVKFWVWIKKDPTHTHFKACGRGC